MIARILRLLFVALLVSTLAINLLPAKKAKAEIVHPNTISAMWIDGNTINVGGSVTVEGKVYNVDLTFDGGDYDNNWRFEASKGGCGSILAIDKDATTSDSWGMGGDWNDPGDFTHAVLQLHIPLDPPTGGCKLVYGEEVSGNDLGTGIGVLNPERQKINYLAYNKGAVLKQVDKNSDWEFYKCTDKSNSFCAEAPTWLRTSEKGDSCQDYIRLPNKDFTVRPYNATESITTYRGFRQELSGSGGSCSKEAKTDVYLGNLLTDAQPPAISYNNGGTQNGDATEQSKTCESEGGKLSWLICPVLQAMDQGITYLDGFITKMLTVSSDYYTNSNAAAAWARMRDLAYIILVPIMLVMVIGTALGFSFLDAYTVKRAMPRLVVAVIFIALSWSITTFLITLTNAVGQGVEGLITSAVSGASSVSLASLFHPTQANSWEAAGFTLWGLMFLLSATTVGIIFSYLLVGIVMLFIGFLILAFRQFLLVALVIIAPLAILAWIFPGNDKGWKLWWSSFSKLLLMFPLITALIGIGKVFAYIIDSVGGSGDINLVNTTLKFVAYLLPFFFIPFTFKFAGGIFATVSGFAQDKTRGFFDAQKKKRQEERAATKERAGQGRRFSNKNGFTRFMSNAAMWGASPVDTFRATTGTFGGHAMLSELTLKKADHTQKLAQAISAAGANDKALRALGWGTAHAKNGFDGQRSTIMKMADDLAATGDSNDAIGAKWLRENSDFLTGVWKNEDYGRASVQAAAGLNLASQGFISKDEIATMSNRLNEDGSGFGNSFKTMAELAGKSAGTHPGYSTRLNAQGEFVEGDVGAMADLVTKKGVADVSGMKGLQIENSYGDGYRALLQAAPTIDPESGRQVVDVNGTKIDAAQQTAVADTLAQVAFASYAAPDVKRVTRQILVDAYGENRVAQMQGDYSRARDPSNPNFQGGPEEPPPSPGGGPGH